MTKIVTLINIIASLFVTLTILNKTSAHTYDDNRNDGPSKWGNISPNCDGSIQSPVDIDFSNVVNGNFTNPLRITRYSEIADSVSVENRYQTLHIALHYQDGKPAQLIGGPLTSKYNIEGIHFHWGTNDLWGSEHSINGKKYSAEAHVVAYNNYYASFHDAINQPDGIAVLAILMNWDNYRKNRIFDLASKVIEANSFYIDDSAHYSIFDVIGHEDYIDQELRVLTYPGSLTTPDCNEVVLWMVAVNPVKISIHDLASLRNLRDEEGNPILKNARPIQKLNGRVVTFQ